METCPTRGSHGDLPNL